MMKKQSGQTVLMVLLVLAVATTLGLSLIGRTTTDVGISSQIEQSGRAFNAAEAGIEEALLTGLGTSTPQVLTPGVSYSTTVTSVAGSATIYELSEKTAKGDTETMWFVKHNADGTLDETLTYTGENVTVCWSRETPQPAVVVTILYKESDDGSYKIAKAAYDPDASRRDDNKFSNVTTPSGLACGKSNSDYHKRNIAFASLGISPNSDILLALRVRPVYADTAFAFDPGTFQIPLQGTRIESVGKTEAGVVRKIVVDKTFTSAPTLFDAAVYSQSGFGY